MRMCRSLGVCCAALAARGALILRVTDFHRSWDRGERHNPQKETERRNQTRVSRDFSCILFVVGTFLLGWPVVVLWSCDRHYPVVQRKYCSGGHSRLGAIGSEEAGTSRRTLPKFPGHRDGIRGFTLTIFLTGNIAFAQLCSRFSGPVPASSIAASLFVRVGASHWASRGMDRHERMAW